MQIERLLAVFLEQGNKARHVGALFLGRQGDRQLPIGYGVLRLAGNLNLNRIAHTAYPYLLNGNLAGIDSALDIGHGYPSSRNSHVNNQLAGIKNSLSFYYEG